MSEGFSNPAKPIGKIYYTATAPTQPPTIPANSLWFAPGNTISVWNGTAWVPQQFVNIIAAGTVVAGIVDGTIVKAGEFVAQGTTGEFLAYTGTAALGNLLASISGAAGTDALGNAYKQGIAVYKGGNPAVLNLIVDPTQNVPAVNLITGVVSEAQFGSVYAITSNAGGVNESVTLWVKGPASTFDNIAEAITFIGSAKDGSVGSAANLMSGGLSIAYWQNNGLHLIQPLWGNAGVLNIGDNLLMEPGKGIIGRDPTWVTVGMASGWTNRGGNYPTFQVMRASVAPGICWIRGNIQTSNSITNGSTIASFGAAYTPLLVQSIPIWVAGGTAVFNDTAHIEVTVGGAVNLWGIGTAGTVQIGFSGVIFLDAL
jgi:hypothetical protein